MTKQEKQDICTFYELGYSCSAIARALGLSYSTVRNYSNEQNITRSNHPKSQKENDALKGCMYCGRLMSPDRLRVDAKYCSDGCRNKNWRLQKSEEDFAVQCTKEEVFPPKRVIAGSKKRLAFYRIRSDELEGEED